MPSALPALLIPVILVTIIVVGVAAVLAFRSTAKRSAPARSRRIWVPGFSLDEQAQQLNSGNLTAAFTALDAIDEELRWQPDLRRPVAAVFCEYLRAADRGEVHSAVQQRLLGLVRSRTSAGGRGGLHLNLQGAQLADLDLSCTQISGLSLARSTLTGTTRLTGVRCAGTIDLTGALIDGDLLADELQTGADVLLTNTVVMSKLDLSGAFVQGRLDLLGAHVQGRSTVYGAVLGSASLGTASSEHAHFEHVVDLRELVCSDIELHGSEFHGGVVITDDQRNGLSRTLAGDDPTVARAVRDSAYYALHPVRTPGPS